MVALGTVVIWPSVITLAVRQRFSICLRNSHNDKYAQKDYTDKHLNGDY